MRSRGSYGAVARSLVQPAVPREDTWLGPPSRNNDQRRLHPLFPVLTIANRAVDDVLTGRKLGRENARLTGIQWRGKLEDETIALDDDAVRFRALIGDHEVHLAGPNFRRHVDHPFQEDEI